MFNLLRNKKIEQEIDREYMKVLKQDLENLEKKYAELLVKNPSSTQEYANRLADIEVKMAKLWALLVDTTPNKQDKLSKYGKVFGGKSKGLL